MEYPDSDKEWDQSHWESLVDSLVELGIVTWKEVASLVLGHVNPPQVGTSIASKKTFQAHFPPRKTMQATLNWSKEQDGECVDCGTRIELQVDHVIPKEEIGDSADRLDNLEYRCRRCNVIKRSSHKNGGVTNLTTESALMWILFVKKPSTYQEYESMCRGYGLTMANIRFKEAWAMAHWLNKLSMYDISEHSKF